MSRHTPLNVNVEYKNHTFRIEYDTDTEVLFDEMRDDCGDDKIGFASFLTRYLGPRKDPHSMARDYHRWRECEYDYRNRKPTDDLDIETYADHHTVRRQYHIIKVYAYIHGNVVLSLPGQPRNACRFDSGTAGFFYLRKRRKQAGRDVMNRAAFLERCEQLVAQYNALSSGDVYQFFVDDEPECGLIVGLDAAVAAAKDHIDWLIKTEATEDTKESA